MNEPVFFLVMVPSISVSEHIALVAKEAKMTYMFCHKCVILSWPLKRTFLHHVYLLVFFYQNIKSVISLLPRLDFLRSVFIESNVQS